MAKKIFTDDSLQTLVTEVRAYADNIGSVKANIGHGHAISDITNLQTTLDGKSNISHTHTYAGSSSIGGSATSAVKLDTATAGSAIRPVYFSGGKPVAGTFTWNWSGQTGQPSWLWGGSDGANMYVYNPSNFSVNYANSSGAVLDYNNTDTPIKVGFAGAGLEGDGINYFAGYGSNANGERVIKDISIDNAKARLGVNDKINRSGDTMGGALNLANNTMNNIGDDVAFGDQNEAGTVVFKGINGNTTIKWASYNGSDSVRLQYDTTNKCLNFLFAD